MYSLPSFQVTFFLLSIYQVITRFHPWCVANKPGTNTRDRTIPSEATPVGVPIKECRDLIKQYILYLINYAVCKILICDREDRRSDKVKSVLGN